MFVVWVLTFHTTQHRQDMLDMLRKTVGCPASARELGLCHKAVSKIAVLLRREIESLIVVLQNGKVRDVKYLDHIQRVASLAVNGTVQILDAHLNKIGMVVSLLSAPLRLCNEGLTVP